MIKTVLREVFTGMAIVTLCVIGLFALLSAFVAIRYANNSHFDIAVYCATYSAASAFILTFGTMLMRHIHLQSSRKRH